MARKEIGVGRRGVRPGRNDDVTRAEVRGRDLLAAPRQGWTWRAPEVWDLLPEWFMLIREPSFRVEVWGLWPDPSPVTALQEERELLWEVVKRSCRDRGVSPPAITEWRATSRVVAEWGDTPCYVVTFCSVD